MVHDRRLIGLYSGRNPPVRLVDLLHGLLTGFRLVLIVARHFRQLMRAMLTQIRQINRQSATGLHFRALADRLTRKRPVRQVHPTELVRRTIARTLPEPALMHQIPVLKQTKHAHERHTHVQLGRLAHTQRASQHRTARLVRIISLRMPEQHKATLVRHQRRRPCGGVHARNLPPRQLQPRHVINPEPLVLRRGKRRVRHTHRPRERRNIDLLAEQTGHRVIQERVPTITKRHGYTAAPTSTIRKRRPVHTAFWSPVASL